MLNGNYSVLHKSPGWFLGGTVAAGDRSNYGKAGGMRNAFWHLGLTAGDKVEAAISSIPHGQAAGGAWLLARKSGGRHALASISLSASGVGAKGRNIAGQSSISITSAGQGGLIAGGVGTADISLSALGAIVATIGSTGAATVTVSGSANIGAIGYLVADATISMGGVLTPYAIGYMQGTTEEQGLSVSGITNAVWAKIVDGGYSAQEVIRLLAAHAAGDATGLEGANPTFKSLDGTKTRIDGSLAAGARTINSRDVS